MEEQTFEAGDTLFVKLAEAFKEKDAFMENKKPSNAPKTFRVLHMLADKEFNVDKFAVGDTVKIEGGTFIVTRTDETTETVNFTESSESASEKPKETPAPTEVPKKTPASTEAPNQTPVPTEAPKSTPAPTEAPKVTPAPTEAAPERTTAPTEAPAPKETTITSSGFPDPVTIEFGTKTTGEEIYSEEEKKIARNHLETERLAAQKANEKLEDFLEWSREKENTTFTDAYLTTLRQGIQTNISKRMQEAQNFAVSLQQGTIELNKSGSMKPAELANAKANAILVARLIQIDYPNTGVYEVFLRWRRETAVSEMQ